MISGFQSALSSQRLQDGPNNGANVAQRGFFGLVRDAKISVRHSQISYLSWMSNRPTSATHRMWVATCTSWPRFQQFRGLGFDFVGNSTAGIMEFPWISCSLFSWSFLATLFPAARLLTSNHQEIAQRSRKHHRDYLFVAYCVKGEFRGIQWPRTSALRQIGLAGCLGWWRCRTVLGRVGGWLEE